MNKTIKFIVLLQIITIVIILTTEYTKAEEYESDQMENEIMNPEHIDEADWFAFNAPF